MVAEDVILAPIISEKSMRTVENKKYGFKVAPNAGKIEIAKAVEKLFSVEVIKVNTVRVRGHRRRMGRYEGYTPAWKKAFVTLSEKSKPIEFFEGLK